jgi:hypothetical protein
MGYARIIQQGGRNCEGGQTRDENEILGKYIVWLNVQPFIPVVHHWTKLPTRKSFKQGQINFQI